ncbi:MAG TPA: 2-dehydropantoate 2-reductase [Alphaproteobacteria bacterium]|nr:2-dehydropantoate 2-reductase [Alphaproteobacteria bacterium]
MRIGIIGAGAIGGQLAVRLANAGVEIGLLVHREEQRAAIAAHGLKLLLPGGQALVARNLRVATDCAALGVQDLVILALKAHQIRAVAPAMRSLFAPATAVLSLQNGIPWWYFQRHGGPWEGQHLAALDPDGGIAAAIAPERIIGSVPYIAGDVIAPGVIRHGGGDRLPIGELDGQPSARIGRISKLLAQAGIKSPILPDIRAEQWFKIWANSCVNPLSALTHSAVGGLITHPATRHLLELMMAEVAAVATRLGVEMRGTLAERMAILEKVGGHKTSMLQDVEAGRALELDALLGALIELGERTEVATPHLAAVYACAKLLDREMAERSCAFAMQSPAAG